MVQKKKKQNIMVVLAYPLQKQMDVGHLDILMEMFKNQLKVFDEVHVASPRDTRKYNLGQNIYVHSINNKGPRILSLRKDAKDIVKIIKENNIALIRTLALTSGYSTMLASKKTSVPYVVSVHRDRKLVEERQSIRRNKIAEKLIDVYESKVLKNAALVPVISNYIKNLVVKKGAPQERIFIHHNFVDTKIFKPSAEKKKNQIIFIGRLDPANGAHLLLNAMPAIVRKNGLNLVIAGVGPQKQELRELAEKLDIQKNVKFIGKLDHKKELPKLLQSSRIFVAPGLAGFTLIETMACSLPVVAVDTEWAHEIVINGKTGILVENNVQGIVNGVEKALKNKGIGKNARKYIKKEFNLDSWKKREVEIYNKALQK